MSREDEIREWLDQIPAMGFDPTDAVEYVRELLDEIARLRAENERLARQRDVLRKWIVSNCQGYIGGAKYILEHRTGDEWFEEREYQKVFLDALSGEGGGA